MKIKNCGLLLFIVFASYGLTKSAVACVDPYQMRYVFLQQLPKKDYGATFIGRIKINTVIDRGSIQIAFGNILQSLTHSDRLNDELILFYPAVTSCDATLNIGDRGLIMGKVVETFSRLGEGNTLITIPFKSQNYIKESDSQPEVGRILHTDEGAIYLKESEFYSQ